MVNILHISDTHAETSTMIRINNLAMAQTDCDVIAHTGDCVSTFTSTLPKEWDRFPQRIKISVPGDHDDHSKSFNNLRYWDHEPPWFKHKRYVSFMGLGLNSHNWVSQLLLYSKKFGYSKALVILCHYNILSHGRSDIKEELPKIVGDRKLLILHGHMHPKGMITEWDDNLEFNGIRVCRSNVCSSAAGFTGIGNRITWNGYRFSCEQVRGEL